MTAHLFDVAGRVALVTGSSRGIGKALAGGLLAGGATVVLNGRSIRALEEARDTLAEELGRTPIIKSFDVTESGAVETGVAAIEAEAGPIDILVNNAGIQRRSSVIDCDDDSWRDVLASNLTSAFLVSRSVARRMAPRGRGKIINVCSVQSEIARPGLAAYSASKGGLKQLTKSMCADLGPHGIQVNGLGPGYIETELTAPLLADEKFSSWIRSRTPAGRWGRVEDLVGGLIFLASAASDFVNGQILYVDGGIVAVL